VPNISKAANRNSRLSENDSISETFPILKRFLFVIRISTQYIVVGDRRDAHRVLVGNLVGRRPLGRSTCRWSDNIKIALREERWWGTDWIDLAQNTDRWRDLVNAVMSPVVS
jgi:hypothetical protein